MKTQFDQQFLEHSTETLRAMAHPIRLAIIDLLHTRGRLSVTEIHQELQIEQAIASHHLRILKSRSVVDLSREGKHSIYFLRHPEFYQILASLARVI